MDYRERIITEISTAILSVNPDELQSAVSRICNSRRIFCDGLGRSALAMRGFAMRLMRLGFQSQMVGESTATAFGTGDTLMMCTASGSSPVLLYHAQLSKNQGGNVILITGNRKNPLVELADETIILPTSNKDSADSERFSIQPRGSLFEQTSQLVCDLMVLEIMEQCRISVGEMRKRHANLE